MTNKQLIEEIKKITSQYKNLAVTINFQLRILSVYNKYNPDAYPYFIVFNDAFDEFVDNIKLDKVIHGVTDKEFILYYLDNSGIFLPKNLTKEDLKPNYKNI